MSRHWFAVENGHRLPFSGWHGWPVFGQWHGEWGATLTFHCQQQWYSKSISVRCALHMGWWWLFHLRCLVVWRWIRRLTCSPEVVWSGEVGDVCRNDVIEHGIPSEDSLICSCYWKDVFEKMHILRGSFFLIMMTCEWIPPTRSGVCFPRVRMPTQLSEWTGNLRWHAVARTMPICMAPCVWF